MPVRAPVSSGRKTLYPEGATSMNIVIPMPLKDTLQEAADRERLSLSQYAVRMLERGVASTLPRRKAGSVA